MAEYDVVVGFSGGVDSCVTALLLRRQGYRVAGVIMSVRDAQHPNQGCGAKEDIDGARRLAQSIDLPLEVMDCSTFYRREVLDYFRLEYLAGRTPNPCVACNPLVKFGAMLDLARARGLRFSHFATGHYAIVEYSPTHGRHILRRGADHDKDQSYFLYRLTQAQLSTVLFPLGGYRKSEVRRIAAELGVPVHDKPDSQDFYLGDYAEMMGEPEREGEIVDIGGKVLGKHRGYWRYTPGQRRGLGVAFSEPLYVLRLEPQSNRVVVGTRSEQMRGGCIIDRTVFHLDRPPAGTTLLGRMRSAQPLHPMTVGVTTAEGIHIHFAAPQHGVAPGQSLVLYDGDVVVGGGVIAADL